MVGIFAIAAALQVLICNGLARLQLRRYQRNVSSPTVAPWTLQAAYKIARQRHYNLLESPWMTPVSGFYMADFFVSASGTWFYQYQHFDGQIGFKNMEGRGWYPPYDNWNHTIGPSLLPVDGIVTDNLLGKLQRGDVVFCRHDVFEEFVAKLLPRLPVPIVLMTGMLNIPEALENLTGYTTISKERMDELSRAVLSSDKVLMWFATNPHLPGNFAEPWQGKYVPMPFGILTEPASIEEVLADGINIQELQNWDSKPEQFYWGPHTIRRRPGLDIDRPLVYDRTQPWPLSGQEPVERHKMLANFLRSRFTLSLAGDRADCFRHWEANIMGAIPICNCHPSFPSSGNNETVKNAPFHFTYVGPNLISLTNEQMVATLNHYKKFGSLPMEMAASAREKDSGNGWPYYYPSAEFASYEFWCWRARRYKTEEEVDRRCGRR